MKHLTDKLLAYAELARATNVPTVVSNVLAGAGLGLLTIDGPVVIAWREILLTAYGVALLYVGGMIMNGVVDADVDAKERPGRPIPSGRVSIVEGWMLAAGAIGVGAASIIVADSRTWLLTTALVACIFGYNFVIRDGKRSLVLMGGCRGIVYPLAALAAGAPRGAIGVAAGVGLIMMLYTIVLSIVARDEVEKPEPKPIAWSLPWLGIAAGLVASLAGAERDDVGLIVVALAVLVGLGSAAKAGAGPRPDPMRSVLGALAGFCLVDTFILVSVGVSDLAVVTMGCFALTIVGHRKLAGT